MHQAEQQHPCLAERQVIGQACIRLLKLEGQNPLISLNSDMTRRNLTATLVRSGWHPLTSQLELIVEDELLSSGALTEPLQALYRTRCREACLRVDGYGHGVTRAELLEYKTAGTRLLIGYLTHDVNLGLQHLDTGLGFSSRTLSFRAAHTTGHFILVAIAAKFDFDAAEHVL